MTVFIGKKIFLLGMYTTSFFLGASFTSKSIHVSHVLHIQRLFSLENIKHKSYLAAITIYQCNCFDVSSIWGRVLFCPSVILLLCSITGVLLDPQPSNSRGWLPLLSWRILLFFGTVGQRQRTPWPWMWKWFLFNNWSTIWPTALKIDRMIPHSEDTYFLVRSVTVGQMWRLQWPWM